MPFPLPEGPTNNERVGNFPTILYLDCFVSNSLSLTGFICGISDIKDTSKVNEFLRMDEVKDILPRDIKFSWTVKPYDPEGKFVQLVALRVTSRDGNAAMEGDVVTDARTDFGQFNGVPEVSMTMSAEGSRQWKRLTADNIGKSIAIVLDDFVETN